jgi:hypothetical protein
VCVIFILKLKKGGKKMKKMRIERSKKGFPVTWEAGGGFTNTGEATIIAGGGGQAKKSIYVRKRGHLANSKHALIPIELGDFVIEADHHRGDFEIKISFVYDFVDEEGETFAIIKQVYCFDKNEWDAELPAFLEAAVEAAKEKATCYHCRKPHFIKDAE